MKPSLRVFFTTSFAGKRLYQTCIDQILDVLKHNHAVITSPEIREQYIDTLKSFETQGTNYERAHYSFIAQGIAGADLVIVEASNEDFRIGHEVTLALMYNKPTLLLSQNVDYPRYIPHELLHGGTYKTKNEAAKLTQDFLDNAEIYLAQSTTQVVDGAADSLHSAALSSLRLKAQLDKTEFGTWVRAAEKDPEVAYTSILASLGNLPVGQPWSVFASIYNEDSPDVIQSGVASFVDKVFKKHGIKEQETILEPATGTGALARVLVSLGYRSIEAFDSSRPMLAEAFRLCAHLPSVKLFEADIATVRLEKPATAAVWIDYSSNFALDTQTLSNWISNLVKNLETGGVLIFDVRTLTGWQVDFYKQKVTSFASEHFQRLWINLPNYDKRLITFDVFIREKTAGGLWQPWKREQMTERMWTLKEVEKVVSGLPGVKVEGIFGDDFRPLKNRDFESGLAYFVLSKV